MATSVFVSDDGMRLPLRQFLPTDGQPHAVVLALHAFNDYSRAFEAPGNFFAARGVALYAYDQRGFGAGPQPGLWPGAARLADDARVAAGLLRRRYPGVPLYVLGESMGGAVALVAAARPGLEADGLILVAPAVLARNTRPWYQRLPMRSAGALWPGAKISAHVLGRQVSDNPDTVQTLEGDPLVIKSARLDTLKGLMELMDQAQAAAPAISQPLLLLHGDHDEIIPREPIDLFWQRLPHTEHQQRRDYAGGWHTLLRDLDAGRVYDDILAWLPISPRFP